MYVSPILSALNHPIPPTKPRKVTFHQPLKSLPNYLHHSIAPSDQLPINPRFITLDSRVPNPVQPLANLPSYWNSKDKSQFLELFHGNLSVAYHGSGKTDMDAASVRANASIPPQSGIFYYEVSIISKGREGYIGIGFCGANVALGRLPGWEDLSWGYHGDDGHSFACSGTGLNYGPVFGTGDVIGVIINFLNMTASYTKNGILLGVAFKDFLGGKRNANTIKLFPCVGLRTPGEVIEANFGQNPFKFDIEQYCQDEKLKLRESINAFPSLFPILSKCHPNAQSILQLKGVHQLIISHLIYHGYGETARSFYKDAMGSLDSENLNGSMVPFDQIPGTDQMPFRQRCHDLIVNGQVHEALSELSTHFPEFFEAKPVAHFQLLCLEFIDRVLLSSGQSRSTQMQVDHTSGASGGLAGMANENLQDLVHFGTNLRSRFAGDPSHESALDELFTLICYTDPQSSSQSYLLDSEHRFTVAEQVNAALFEYLGYSRVSKLDRLVCQLSHCLDTLKLEDVGAASYLDPRDCFQ